MKLAGSRSEDTVRGMSPMLLCGPASRGESRYCGFAGLRAAASSSACRAQRPRRPPPPSRRRFPCCAQARFASLRDFHHGLLAFAGANLPPNAAGSVPGLVIAEALSTLDLTGCDLAVLSACDTNVGERRAGQGVVSLQKDLHMACARSVITSLWKVPDEATSELMLDFYRRLWVEQKPKHQALWEAKLRLRDARDERGEHLYTTRDWAAWVLTGDPD